MTKSEVIGQIGATRGENDYFIKFYKTGHQLVDIDLIDNFIKMRDQSGEIDEYELLDMEQMWQTLIDLDPDKLARLRSGEKEVIEWTWKDASGTEKKTRFPYTPEGIMQIVNDELFA